MTDGTARTLLGLVAVASTFGAMACEPVTSLPATLKRGVYCLTDDVGANGTLLFTLENDATLDCRGHRISDATFSTANAVYSASDNISVTNCVFDGFATPVWLDGASHFRIVGNRFSGATQVAVDADGSEGLIAGNVLEYQHAPHLGYSPDRYGQSIGIQVRGLVDVIGNTVSAAMVDGGAGWTDRGGIFSSSDGGVIAFNVVRGLMPGDDHWRRGIVAQGHGAVVYRNIVSALPMWPGTYNDVGVGCTLDGEAIVAENIVLGFAIPYLRCPAAQEPQVRRGGRRKIPPSAHKQPALVKP